MESIGGFATNLVGLFAVIQKSMESIGGFATNSTFKFNAITRHNYRIYSDM